MTAYIAILGDLHGHYTLAFTLLKRWEQKTGKTLDALLQVGDMGIFPEPDVRLDEATKRFAEKDSDEISFRDFYRGEGDASLFFDGDNPLFNREMYFIRGNHEDFEFLDALKSRDGVIAVDHYRKFLYIADGTRVEIKTRAGVLQVGGLGGLEQKGSTQKPWHFANNAYRRALALSNIDILLTHEPPADAGKGSEKIRALIEYVQPTYHFCGHIHEEGRQLPVRGKTQSYLMNEVNFHGQRNLRPKGIGILSWNGKQDHAFTYVGEPWLEEYTRQNYREKLRE
jgi:Icc-related predicted phosphoesterase